LLDSSLLSPGTQREADYKETAMRCSGWGSTVLVLSLCGPAFGQSTPPPSYSEIDAAIGQIEKQWQGLDTAASPDGSGWAGLFATLRGDLKAYATASDADSRVAALNRLHKTAASLDSTPWQAAAQLRDDLRYWLAPRITLAWAEYQTLAQNAKGTPERERWTDYIEKTLRPAVGALEGARTADERAQAVDAIDEVIHTLQAKDSLPLNAKSDTLLAALSGLYLQPNLEITIDHSALSSFILPRGIVEAGPIFFKGQWSYVTPGPVQGIGFSPTADGIQVVVRQSLTSITPIRGFEQQMEAADPRAQQATSMYHFAATSRDDAVLTMVALFRLGTGLQMAPGYEHAVNAAITTTPVPGAGMKRFIASLIGQGQRRITDKVYEQSITKMRDSVAANARELSTIRTTESAARLNAQIRPYILDGRTVGIDRMGVTDLRLFTAGDHATALGTLYSFDGPKLQRATFAQPRRLNSFQPGITADLHLPSVLANLVQGAYQNPEVQNTTSIQIEATAGAPDAKNPPTITRNVDFPAYLQSVQSGVPEGKPATIVRLMKPSRPPEFSVGTNGDLIVLVSDFQLDVPAPTQVAGGIAGSPPASVYRLKSPLAKIGLGLYLDRSNPAVPPALKAKVTSINLEPNSSVLAIQQDEAAATALNPLMARVVTTAFGTRVVGQSFDLPISALNRPDISLIDISPLDPSGWFRLVLSAHPQG
jgi:hypothetical protein